MGYEDLIPGNRYSRKEVAQLIGLPPEKQKGNWSTGHTRFNNAWLIFTNVGTAGRTGHNYGNRWAGNELEWSGRTGSRTDHETIQSLLRLPVHIFTRSNDRDPFDYEGIGKPVRVEPTVPVRILWSFSDSEFRRAETLPEEIQFPERFAEGARTAVWVSAVERNPAARRACIRHWGTRCMVCNFDFAKFYGHLGAGFIHVHHLKPISEVQGEYEVDPVNDLRPV